LTKVEEIAKGLPLAQVAHTLVAAHGLQWQCLVVLALDSAASPGTSGGSRCEVSRSLVERLRDLDLYAVIVLELRGPFCIRLRGP